MLLRRTSVIADIWPKALRVFNLLGMIIYKDWKNEELPMGEAEIVEFLGFTPVFELNGLRYRGEKCIVKFLDNTTEEAVIRVMALEEAEFSPKVTMQDAFYQDRFQVFRDEKGALHYPYDTTIWNERIGDFSSFGNIF